MSTTLRAVCTNAARASRSVRGGQGPWVEDQGQDVLGAGQADRPQGDRNILAETSGIDQDEPLDELRVLVEELRRHSAAQTVPDDRGRVDVQGDQKVTYQARKGA